MRRFKKESLIPPSVDQQELERLETSLTELASSFKSATKAATEAARRLEAATKELNKSCERLKSAQNRPGKRGNG